MNKRCPVCRQYSIDTVPRREICLASYRRNRLAFFKEGYIYYTCTHCGWTSCYDTARRLAKMGHSIEPEVVYLVELLTIKRSLVDIYGEAYKHRRRIYCDDTGHDMKLVEDS